MCSKNGLCNNNKDWKLVLDLVFGMRWVYGDINFLYFERSCWKVVEEGGGKL